MRRRIGTFFACGLVCASAVLAATTSAAGAQTETSREEVDRILVLSVPGIGYRDLDLARLPNLRGLLESSALADLSARGVHRRPTLGDGYVTIGAGARSLGRPLDDGQCLDAAEPFEGDTARETMARRAGIAPADIPGAAVVCLAQPALVARNENLLYDAQVGLTGEELAKAGIQGAVIGNADLNLSGPPNRPVGLALADPDGVVPAGTVGTSLLTSDADAPFGVRADNEAYLAAFERTWSRDSVVVVEASDLVRFDAYRPVVAPDARTALLTDLLGSFDELVGQLLRRVDPERDAVMIVGPTPLNGTAKLTMAALRAPNLRPGLLVSAYTRHSGLVSIVDVSPTMLELFGIERPSEMEGRPFEYARRGGDFDHRIDWLISVDEAARFRDRMIAPVTTFIAVAVIALTIAAVLALSLTRWRPARPAIEVVALTLLGFLPAAYIARLLPFEDWGWLAYWSFLFACAIVLGVAVWMATSRTGIVTLIVILSIVVGVIAIDVLTGAHLQFNSTLGYSPTVAGRYAGIGNLAYAQLSAGMLLLAGLLAARIGGRRGALVAIVLLAVAIVVDGTPVFGADVGGVMSMVPAYAVTATMLLGWRVRWSMVALYGGITVVLLAVFAAFDAGRPEDRQTHLGRLVHTTSDGGWDAFSTVVQRKIDANLDVLLSSVWTVMLPIVLAGVVYIVFAAPSGLRTLVDRVLEIRAALVGLAVLAVLGFILNDSGIAVPAMMLGVVAPALAVLAMRGDRALADADHVVDEVEPLRELVRT